MLANHIRRAAQAVLLLTSLALLSACQSATDSEVPGDSATPTGIAAATATPIPTPSVSPSPTPAFECADGEQELLPYRDEALGIAFCYPTEWRVEDRVEESGFLVVSPGGFDASVGETQMVLIYPHDPTLASSPLMWADAFFTQIVPDAELVGEPEVVDEEEHGRVTYVARGTTDGEPVSGVVSGIIQNGFSAMAIAYIYDEPQSTAMAEQIVASVETKPARIELTVAPGAEVRSGEYFTGEWLAEEPGVVKLNVADDTPLLIVAEASQATDVNVYDPQGVRLTQFTASFLMSYGDEDSLFGDPDAYLLEPEMHGEYVLVLEGLSFLSDPQATFRLSYYPLEGEESGVLSRETHQIDPGQTNSHEFTVSAGRPHLIFVRPLGEPAQLRLASYDTAGTKQDGNLPMLTGRILQWVPEEAGAVQLEVSSEAGASADYEIIVLRVIMP